MLPKLSVAWRGESGLAFEEVGEGRGMGRGVNALGGGERVRR